MNADHPIGSLPLKIIDEDQGVLQLCDEPPPAGSVDPSNPNLHFHVDESTKLVTIFMGDPPSIKVLHTIPITELHKIDIRKLLIFSNS